PSPPRLRGAVARLLAAMVVAVGIGLPAQAIAPQPVANAANAASFDPGMLIADELFFDGNAMTAAQIQQFLDASIGSCQNGRCLNVITLNFPARSRVISTSTGRVRCEAVAGGRVTAPERLDRGHRPCGRSAQVSLVT